jgi:hypothetical protein
VSVEVAPGEPIRATSRCGDPPAEIVFDTGCSLVGVRTRTEPVKIAAVVPVFDATGHVKRGSDGSAEVHETILERERCFLEADAADAAGKKRTFTRAPTDG